MFHFGPFIFAALTLQSSSSLYKALAAIDCFLCSPKRADRVSVRKNAKNSRFCKAYKAQAAYTCQMSSPLLFAIASLIWGSTFWAITWQLGSVPPAISVVYRFALASAALFCWCRLRGDRLRLPWKTQRWLLLQGFCTFALSYVCTYNSEQYVVSALVAVMFALMVFWNPIGARMAFGTRIGWRTWCAGAVAICGVTLLFSHALVDVWHDLGRGLSPHFLLGIALALMATIASSAGNVVVVQVRKHSANVPLTMAWAMLWGTLCVAIYALLSGQPWRMPPDLGYWASLLYLSLFGSVFAFAAYFTLIHRVGAQKAVYTGVVTPVISVLLSIRFEHYHPGPIEWLGMALCLAGVLWAVQTDDEPARPARSARECDDSDLGCRPT